MKRPAISGTVLEGWNGGYDFLTNKLENGINCLLSFCCGTFNPLGER